MSRNRKSAKAAGTRFERDIADYLAGHVDDRIDRRVRNGNKDRGDIAGLRHMGERVVVEVKNTTRWTPAAWLAEAEIERGNDDALVGMVVAKRRGVTHPGSQYVLMSLDDLIALLTAERPEHTP